MSFPILDQTNSPESYEAATRDYEKPSPLAAVPWGRVLLGAVVVLLFGIWFIFLRQPKPKPWPETPDPVQTPIAGGMELPAWKGWTFEAMDTYDVEAMVMSRERYSTDNTGDIAPVDWMLGWGPLTREDCLDAIQYEQSQRWGYYRWGSEGLPIPPKEVARHSANTHIIPEPGNEDLWKQVLKVRRGDVVRFSGYLVKVNHAGLSGSWKSSRSRTDTDKGACEIVYVTSLEVVN